MTKPLNREHAEKARKALAACDPGTHQDLVTPVSDLLADLAHLCDAEGLSFLEIIKKAIATWQVERIDPTSIAPGPPVEITIGTEGLPPPPAAKPPRRTKPKKARVPR